MLSKLIKCKNKYYDKNGEQPLTCIYHLRIQLKTFDRVCYGGLLKVLEKRTKNLIGHSRLAFNNHESNIDC